MKKLVMLVFALAVTFVSANATYLMGCSQGRAYIVHLNIYGMIDGGYIWDSRGCADGHFEIHSVGLVRDADLPNLGGASTDAEAEDALNNTVPSDFIPNPGTPEWTAIQTGASANPSPTTIYINLDNINPAIQNVLSQP